MNTLKELENIANDINVSSTAIRLRRQESNLEIIDQDVSGQDSCDLNNAILRSKLLNLIYKVYFDGSYKSSNGINKNIRQDLERIDGTGVDWGFYGQLDKCNERKVWYHPNFLVASGSGGDQLRVKYDGNTLTVSRKHHLHPMHSNAKVGDLVSVLLPNHYIKNEFYVSFNDTSDEFDHVQEESFARNSVYIYLNFRSSAAVDALGFFSRNLNKEKVLHSFQVLHNPLNYNRHYVAILRFDRSAYDITGFHIHNFYLEHSCLFENTVPILTKTIMPGVAISERPKEENSFGLNRCRILANAIADEFEHGNGTIESKMKFMIENLEKSQIDINKPYLNPGSGDSYKVFST
jgi:hypothetical protein